MRTFRSTGRRRLLRGIPCARRSLRMHGSRERRGTGYRLLLGRPLEHDRRRRQAYPEGLEPATVGRAGPLADRDLLARSLSYVDRIARAEKGLRGQVAPRKDMKKEGSLADSPSCREERCSRKPRSIGPHTDTILRRKGAYPKIIHVADHMPCNRVSLENLLNKNDHYCYKQHYQDHRSYDSAYGHDRFAPLLSFS